MLGEDTGSEYAGCLQGEREVRPLRVYARVGAGDVQPEGGDCGINDRDIVVRDSGDPCFGVDE